MPHSASGRKSRWRKKPDPRTWSDASWNAGHTSSTQLPLGDDREGARDEVAVIRFSNVCQSEARRQDPVEQLGERDVACANSATDAIAPPGRIVVPARLAVTAMDRS